MFSRIIGRSPVGECHNLLLGLPASIGGAAGRLAI
ncbi:MAG: DUF2391 family protein [Elainellaceae cyanobacterium]